METKTIKQKWSVREIMFVCLGIIISILIMIFVFPLFVALAIITLIVYLLKQSKKKNKKLETIENAFNSLSGPIPISELIPVMTAKITFNAAGVTKKNNEGEKIQGLLRGWVKEEISEPYRGLTNTEIKELYEDGEDERIYEADDVSGDYDVYFEPEPDNSYDKDAVKVMHKRFGHIGYVPAVDALRVFKIINDENYNIQWKIVGGKYKIVECDDDEGSEGKVKTITDNYGIKINIYKKVEVT